MATTAMQRRRRFNPTEYKEEFIDLMKANPAMAAKAATDLARRKRNQDDELDAADHATKELAAFLGTTIIMAAAGWWSGGMKAKRDALIADWEVEGAESVGATLTETPEPWDHERGVKDPCCWWFVPKLMVFPVVTGIMAAVAAGMRKGRLPSAFERTMTMAAGSTFGLVIASIVGSWSYKKSERKLDKMAELTSVKPAQELQPTGT